MLVNKHEGEQLKQFLLNSDDETRKKASLTAEFKVQVREDNRVFVELWYTPSDDKSLDFIRNFSEFVKPILDDITFYARPVTWACPHCEESWKKKNCVSDGLYCAMQHDNNLHIDGKEVIMESLRHFCINQFAEKELAESTELFLKTKGEYWHNLVLQGEKEDKKLRRNSFFKYLKASHELCRNRMSE